MDRRATEWSGHAELVRIVHQVRRRWRMKIALRGAAIMLAAALGIFLISAFMVDRMGFSPAAVLTARIVLAVAVVALLFRFLLLPLRRRVSDEQVALYIEEHEPSLRSSLISALSASEPESALSPALARRTIETALQRCRQVQGGVRIESRALRRASGALGGVVVAGLILFLLGPDFVRFGARAIFLPLRSAEAAATSYRVLVQPGDTSVARGADLPISAVLSGFTSEQVDVVVRFEGDSILRRVPMLPSPEGTGYEVRLFDLEGAAEYYVQAGAVRSPAFRVSVLDLPYVERIDLELHFPEYTGLEPRIIQDGGDIAAPAGTTVRLRATPTLPVDSGRVVLSDGRSVQLQRDSAGVLTGAFRVSESGLYHLELQTAATGATPGSPQYLIDVLDDLAPTVEFSKPGRDTHVTSVDEVFLEARAQDDYGIRSLELVYSVNGGPEQKVPLYGGGTLSEVITGHTIYLEEMDLQPGDFISYYARATDVGPGQREAVTSDIYFVEVRPFSRNYRQADSGGGGGGGSGQGDPDAGGELSQRQRELIAATFNMVRDRERYSDEEYRENLVTLSLAQEKLQEQALTLAQRLANRGVARDTAFQVITRALPMAAAEMAKAVDRLRDLSAPDALPPEQRALLHLQRAEAAYREVQVRMGAQGGGGGGGGATAQDLADLFGLELDQLQNQYETVRRGGDQSSAARAEIDETAARVRELARRLERENERLRQAMTNQIRNGNAAANQRALADETEEAARRLERLSREQSRPDLAETARQLRQAAEAMRRAAADGRSGNAGASREALDRLREATRRLNRSQVEGARSEAEQIAEEARRLAEEGREIREQMQNLPDSPDRLNEGRRLAERKEQQAQAVDDLQRDLEALAAETRSDQPDASRRLQAAAESARRNRLSEAIRASRAATQPNAPSEYVRQLEEHIGEGLEELQRLTEEASRSFRTPEDSRAQESLDRARDLVRGLQSMRERTRQAMGTQMSNRQGGQDGQSGQPQAGGEQGGEQGGTQPSGRLGDRPGGRQPGQGEGAQAQNGQTDPSGQGGQQGQPGQGREGQQGQGGQQGEAGQQGQGDQQGQPGDAQARGQGQQGQGQAGEQGQGGRAGQGAGEGDEYGEAGRRLGEGPSGLGFGSPGTGWSNGGPRPGSPDPEAIRQLRAETAQRLQEARELRRELAELGVSTEDLDRAIAELARLDDQRVYADWEELEHIQAAIVERVKEFEFELRQTIEGEETRKLFLSGSGEVPPAYRELVERYYRELSETGR